MFSVRRAMPEDATALIDLVNDVATRDDTLGIDRFPLAPQDEATFLGQADPRVYLTLVAQDGTTGRLLGVLTASRGTDTKLQHVSALAIAVAAGARRHGVGSAMLEGFIDWAREVGVTKCTLSVLAHNEAAIRLFSKAGFSTEATRKGQYRVGGRLVDEVLMANWLDGRGGHHGQES